MKDSGTGSIFILPPKTKMGKILSNDFKNNGYQLVRNYDPSVVENLGEF